MKHRHLEFLSGTPIDELPSAAIVDLLERGDLDDWRPLVVAIARDPSGPFATRFAGLLDAFPMYGTSPLWRAFLDRCRAREEGRRTPRRAATLSLLRRRMGLTQVELARRLGITQSDLSKLERRTDLRLSTLRKYAAALGGNLHLLFEGDGEPIEVRPAEGKKTKSG
jgi:DNA-binding Xre family transcriptional regulator